MRGEKQARVTPWVTPSSESPRDLPVPARGLASRGDVGTLVLISDSQGDAAIIFVRLGLEAWHEFGGLKEKWTRVPWPVRAIGWGLLVAMTVLFACESAGSLYLLPGDLA